MNERKTYQVSAQRHGRFWLLDVPDLQRVTQARRLGEAETMTRELIALVTGEPADSFDVAVRPQIEPELNDLVIRATAARARAAGAQAEASNLLREAARALTDAGMTIRDVGGLLGVTHQRVAQLLATQPEAPHAASTADALGDPDKIWDVYTVGDGHRRATAGELIDEARQAGPFLGGSRPTGVTKWSEIKRRKGAPD